MARGKKRRYKEAYNTFRLVLDRRQAVVNLVRVLDNVPAELAHLKTEPDWQDDPYIVKRLKEAAKKCIMR